MAFQILMTKWIGAPRRRDGAWLGGVVIVDQLDQSLTACTQDFSETLIVGVEASFSTSLA